MADDMTQHLEEIVRTAAEVGVRIQMSGGYTERVRESTHRVALALGCEEAECTVSSVSVGLTGHRDGRSRTVLRRAPVLGVNFSELSELTRLVRSVEGLTLDEFRSRMDTIESHHRRYPMPVVLIMLGVACACLSVLFGADAVGAVLAGVAGAVAATLRDLLLRRSFVPFVATCLAAFVASGVVLLLVGLSSTRTPVLAASVLCLVPGVPLLNGTADLVTGNYLNAVVRLTMGWTLLLAIALGVTVALGLQGLS